MKFIRLSLFVYILFLYNTLSAQIEVSDTIGCAPITISFNYKTSATLTNIYWDFNDQGTYSSNTLQCQHTYANPGTYTITFSAKDGSTPINATKIIKIFGKPTANFKADTLKGCTGLQVNFHDLSTGSGGTPITKWNWTYGDMQGTTGNANPSHFYTADGKWTVSLIVEDQNGCSNIITKNAYISTSTPPNPVITSTNLMSCNTPFQVTFKGENSTVSSSTSLSSYLWTLGNGKTSTLNNPAEQTYTASANVLLTVTDLNHCSASSSRYVFIGKPKASFYVNDTAFRYGDTVCNSVYFYNKSDYGYYTWDFNYNNNISNKKDTVPFTYPNTGKYNSYFVKLTVNSGLCTNDTTIKIIVESVKAGFTSTPHYGCNGTLDVQFSDTSKNAIKWDWAFSDTTISKLKNPNHTYHYLISKYSINGPQYFTDVLMATGRHGCTNIFTKQNNDTLWRPNAAFLVDKTMGCIPLTVNFKDTSSSREPITNWEWDFGDGSAKVTTQHATHTFTKEGEYDVILKITNQRGCIDTSYAIHIKAGKTLTPDFTVNKTSVCPGEAVSFDKLAFPLSDSVDMWHYNTDGTLLSACPYSNSQTWGFISEAKKHDVTLTVGFNGCYSSATQSALVEVKGPVAKIESAFMQCNSPYDYTFTSKSTGYDNITWDFGDSNTDSGSPVTHTYNSTVIKDYKVILTATNNTSGCPIARDTILVQPRKPVAKITIDSVLCGNLGYTFSAANSKQVNAVAHFGYVWNFDKTTCLRHTQGPVYPYKYSSSGFRRVYLEVTDINGCKDTTSKQILIQNVYPNFVMDKNYGCAPLTVHFTDSSKYDYGSKLASWTWKDSAITYPNPMIRESQMALTQNPTYTFVKPLDSAIIHHIVLTITDSIGCSRSITKPVFLSLPKARFTASTSQNICIGNSVTFNPLAIPFCPYNYTWDFGDKNTAFSINSNTYTHQFDSSGYFNIKLSVTDSIGCKDSLIKPAFVYVQSIPDAKIGLLVNGTLSNDSLFCLPAGINYNNLTSYPSYLSTFWDLGSGYQYFSGDPAVNYETPGTHIVKIKVQSSNGCMDEAIRSFKTIGPKGKMSIDRNLICKGEAINFSMSDTAFVSNYVWDFGDGKTDSTHAPAKHYYLSHPQTGSSVLAQLILYTEGKKCNMALDTVINIYHVVANFTIADTAHCLNVPDLLTNTSIGNIDYYRWDLGDFSQFTNQNTVNHTYANAGTYPVQLVVADNQTTHCKDTIVKHIQIFPLPDLLATGGNICRGQSTQLSALSSTAITYQWTPSTGLSNDVTPNPTANPIETTSYTMVVTDNKDCQNSNTIVVYVQQPPVPFYLVDTIIIGESIALGNSLGNGFQYAWTPKDSLSCDSCSNPIANPQAHTTYNVIISDKMHCFSAINSRHEIFVLPLSSVDLPVAFTPGTNDGNNIVKVRGWGIKRLLEFKIYNRWGELIFETTNINEGWDGTYKGKPQNTDSYVYVVTVEPYVGTSNITKKGVITLLR